MLSLRQLCAICVVFFLTCLSASAQVLYGSLTGVVTDSGGAVLPNAAVKVTNTETAQEVSETTNAAGSFTFSNLAPGPYDIAIQAPGFRTLNRRGVAVTANTVRRE